MKTMIARVAVIGTLLAVAGAADAQFYETYRPKESIYLFNYEVSNALGTFSDKFISETSWRGFGFEGRSMVRDRISVGLGFDFNRYSQTHSMVTQAAGSGWFNNLDTALNDPRVALVLLVPVQQLRPPLPC